MTIFSTSVAQSLYKLTKSTLSNIQYCYLRNDVAIYNKKLKGMEVSSGFYKARAKISKRFLSISAAQKELKKYIRTADALEGTTNYFQMYDIISSPSLQKLENILKMNISILEGTEKLLKEMITKNRKVYGYNPETLHNELSDHRARRTRLIEIRVALNDYIVMKTVGKFKVIDRRVKS